MQYIGMFPSPLEVNRLFYHIESAVITRCATFPAPIEVDRELYIGKIVTQSLTVLGLRPLSRLIGIYTYRKLKGNVTIFQPMFPAPREVDRWIYRPRYIRRVNSQAVSVPLRGR